MFPRATRFLQVICLWRAAAGDSAKKGIAYTPESVGGDVALGHVAWYFNYGLTPTLNLAQTGVEYVPMAQLKYDSLTFHSPPQALLGFDNTADAQGGVLSPQAARALWHRLSDSGARLVGAPCLSPETAVEWLREFFAPTEAFPIPPSVGFIPVRWHGRNASDLLAHLEHVFDAFHLPLWLTEFSFADVNATASHPSTLDTSDVIAFLDVAIPALEALAYVHRYAWLSDPRDPTRSFASLWTREGALTPVGETYTRLTYPPPSVSVSRCAVDGSSWFYAERIAFKRRRRSLSFNQCPNHMCVCQRASCGGWDNTLARARNVTVEVPLFPLMARSVTYVDSPSSVVGVALNGVYIYGHAHGQSDAPLEDVDACGGSAGEDGAYHYRMLPSCLLRQLNRTAAPDLPPVYTHSAQIGWALDGFPIYGPIGYKGIPMYACSHTLAHPELCLDECNGLEAELRKVDEFRYRYYLPGPLADAVCSASTVNRGPCARADAPCCPSVVPAPSTGPLSMSCLRGCSTSDASCVSSNTKGIAPAFYPELARAPDSVFHLSQRSFEEPTYATNTTNATFPSTPSNASTHALSTLMRRDSEALIRYPFNDSLGLLSSTSDASGLGSVTTTPLPVSARDALISALVVEMNTVFFCTQLGVFSVSAEGGATDSVVSGLVFIVIRGYNLGEPGSSARVLLGGTERVPCSSVLVVDATEIRCTLVLQINRYAEGASIHSNLAENLALGERLTLETAAGAVSCQVQPASAGPVDPQPFSSDDLISGSGRPVITSATSRAAPFRPYAIALSTEATATRRLMYVSDFASNSILQIDNSSPRNVATVVSGVSKVYSLCAVSLGMLSPATASAVRLSAERFPSSSAEELLFYVDPVRGVVAYVRPSSGASSAVETVVLSDVKYLRGVTAESADATGSCLLLVLLVDGTVIQVSVDAFLGLELSGLNPAASFANPARPTWLTVRMAYGSTSMSRYSAVTLVPSHSAVSEPSVLSSRIDNERVLR